MSVRETAPRTGPARPITDVGGDQPAPRPRRRWLRLAAVFFILYGLFGIGLLGYSALEVAQPIDDISEITVSIEDQREALLRSLDDTAQTVSDAAAGVRNLDASLGQARRSSESAASLARDVAFTMSEISRAMQIQIFGQQPFNQLASGFDRAGQQLNQLGTDLDGIASAIDQNSEDAATTAANLSRLERTIERLHETVEEGPRLEVSSEALAVIRLALFGLIGWLLIFAVASIILGLGLWRWAGIRSSV